MSQDKIFIHVGLHKTGTTFIQKEIFSKLKNVNYIHPPRIFLQSDLFSKVPKVRVSFFHPEKAFGDIQEYKPKLISNKINIISRESLSGTPFVGYFNADTRFIIADRIKKLYPNAKIIIGIRKKKSWLFSSYGQYIKSGGTQNFYNWFKNVFDINYLNFNVYIKYLEEKFNDVYVYKYEDLKNKPENFVKNLCNYIDVEVPEYNFKVHNKGLNDRQMNLARFLNRFYRCQLNPNGFLFRYMFNPNKIINLFS